MAKKKRVIIVFLILASLLGLFFYASENTSKNPPLPDSLTTQKEKVKAPQFTKTILEVNGEKYDTEITDNSSVYDFMNKLQEEKKINFTSKTYTGMGKLIVAINGIRSGNERTWIYYVNGIEAQVGVSNYKIKSGDIISWKYE